MAKKRRKPRTRPRTEAGTGTTMRTTEDEPREVDRPAVLPGQRSRAEKKELGRRAREAALKRARRQHAYRRALLIGLVAAVALGVVLFITRVAAPGDVPESALRAAQTAGCGDVQTPTTDPQAGHLAQGETLTYEQRPATSGRHALAPLPPDSHVYTSPVQEIAAVHNLEHAYVLIYYRAEGADALPQDVVDELARLAESEDKVIIAPYPSLDEGTSLALAAWNKLWECPSVAGAAEARTIASGFIEAYRGTGNAPEPGAA